MVKRGIALLSGIFAAALLSAEIIFSGSTGFTTGALFLNEDTQWVSSGNAKLTLESGKRDAVKALIAASFMLNSIPLAVSGSDTISAGTASLSLERAYIKFRFPWIIADSSLRFSLGKMPLAWGKGFYFNASDIIFGARPSEASLDAEEFRTAAKWMAAVYMPFGDFTFAEIIALPPWKGGSADANTGISEGVSPLYTGKEDGRIGGRLVLAPGWAPLDSLETGYLYTPYRSSHQMYAALDGTLYADYNLGVSFSIFSDPVQNIRDTLTASAGIFKNFFIPLEDRDMPLSLRFEALCYPYTAKAMLFPSINIGITGALSAVLSSLISIPENTAQLALSVLWKPFSGLQLSAAVFLRADKIESGSGFSFSGTYKF